MNHSSNEEWCVGDEDCVSKIWLDRLSTGSIDDIGELESSVWTVNDGATTAILRVWLKRGVIGAGLVFYRYLFSPDEDRRPLLAAAGSRGFA